MAKDGIQLIALAKVTVRANIDRLVGGAGEETILARVGEGIVSTIGSSRNHKGVLENPDSIDQMTLKVAVEGGNDDLKAAIEASIQGVLKLRGAVAFVAADELPDDGRVIEDARQLD